MLVPFYFGRNIMQWINVNEKYLDYMRQFERRIPYTDYGLDKYNPFFGILFKKDNLCYITQISHAQPRHIKMKNQPDFFKIYDPQELSRLIAVVNLNYMFPIPKEEVSILRSQKLIHTEYLNLNKRKANILI